MARDTRPRSGCEGIQQGNRYSSQMNNEGGWGGSIFLVASRVHVVMALIREDMSRYDAQLVQRLAQRECDHRTCRF